MLSAFILSELGYSTLLLAEQWIHQRFVRPGPLVLGSASCKHPTPVPDRDRTVSRRSEPSSRAALIGEQPNPWDLLQPQDATSRHQVPNLPVAVNAWGRSACYPQSTFYPLSNGNSTLVRGITKPYFRICLTRQSAVKPPYAFTLYA